MAETWNNIGNRFHELRESCRDATRSAALASIEKLVAHIAKGPLASALYGWSSMSDLCVQQLDVQPFSGPFLRVSPQADGAVEFRYHDTAIEDRQWTKRVPPEGVVGRFDAFLEQLHWHQTRRG